MGMAMQFTWPFARGMAVAAAFIWPNWRTMLQVDRDRTKIDVALMFQLHYVDCLCSLSSSPSFDIFSARISQVVAE